MFAQTILSADYEQARGWTRGGGGGGRGHTTGGGAGVVFTSDTRETLVSCHESLAIQSTGHRVKRRYRGTRCVSNVHTTEAS